MKNLTWILRRMLRRKKFPLVCQRCRKPLDEPTYVLVRGDVIVNTRAPQVFTCPEQAFNYAQGIVMHTVCWIKTLREHGAQLYDMNQVYEDYKKEVKHGLG